jgi:hypothetical protein
MSGLVYVGKEQLQFRRREGALLLDVCIDCVWTNNVHVLRAFPLSNPNAFFSIRDGEQKELGLLESLDGFDEATQKLVTLELERRYFTPQITKINSLKNDVNMWRFNVETTRGPSDFYVRNWRDSAYELTPGRWQIMSVDGGRYEILSLDALDTKSQILIEQLL